MDRRSQYTIDLIKSTFLELLKEKSVEKITVTEICKIADINRTTFYNYYDDVYVLLNHIENKLLNQVKEIIDQYSDEVNVDEFVYKIIQTIYLNKDICIILFGKYGNKDFIKKVIYLSYITGSVKWSNNLKEYSSEEIDYIFMFFAHGCIGIIEKWIDSDFQEDYKVIASLINKLSKKLLN